MVWQKPRGLIPSEGTGHNVLTSLTANIGSIEQIVYINTSEIQIQPSNTSNTAQID